MEKLPETLVLILQFSHTLKLDEIVKPICSGNVFFTVQLPVPVSIRSPNPNLIRIRVQGVQLKVSPAAFVGADVQPSLKESNPPSHQTAEPPNHLPTAYVVGWLINRNDGHAMRFNECLFFVLHVGIRKISGALGDMPCQSMCTRIPRALQLSISLAQCCAMIERLIDANQVSQLWVMGVEDHKEVPS